MTAHSSSSDSDSATVNTSQVWDSLKHAIAQSSGFHRWKLDRENVQDLSLDGLVHQYLRETLETLAY